MPASADLRALPARVRRALPAPIWASAPGAAALLLLVALVPIYNPAAITFRTERVYIGNLLGLAAGAAAAVVLLKQRRRWVFVAVALAAAYGLLVALLRNAHQVSLLANTYRPLQAPVIFLACALIIGARGPRFWRLAFVGAGALSCLLALGHAVYPAFDPFALSRPTDIPYAATFVNGVKREAGAFVYPGNFGPYAEYVALVALVSIEQLRLRLVAPTIYTLAFVVGLAGILASGSRNAALGALAGIAVVIWRTPRLRFPVLATGCAVTLLAAAAAAARGTLDSVLTSRVSLVGGSLSLRLDSWRPAFHVLRESPVVGAGITPGTIDGTIFYYLYVGGIAGLLVIAALYGATLVRPLRKGNTVALPLLAGVLATGIFQDSLGEPLVTWSFAVGAFVLTGFGSARWLEDDAVAAEAPAGRRTWANRSRLVSVQLAAIAAVVALAAAAGAATGQLHRHGNLFVVPKAGGPGTPVLIEPGTIIGAPLAKGDVLATSDGTVGSGVWVVSPGPRNLRVRSLTGKVVPVAIPRTPTHIPAHIAPPALELAVTRWSNAAPALVAAWARGPRLHVRVVSLSPRPRLLTKATLPLPLSHLRHARTLVSVAPWSRAAPDLAVLEEDSGSRSRTGLLSIYASADHYRRRILSRMVPLPPHHDGLRFGMARLRPEARPDAVFLALGRGSVRPLLWIDSSDSRFQRPILSQRVTASAYARGDRPLAIAGGPRSAAFYMRVHRSSEIRVEAFPLRLQCQTTAPFHCYTT
jgi:O-antigen ligase/polysaccharide polymerase Wzy-like membrane protein